MKIEKLPSGSYRVRKMYKGKTYTVIFDYKPTQKEAIEEMAKELGKMKEKSNGMTFSVAAQEYIESKRNVLSPSTIRGYDMIIRRIPSWFMEKNVHDITQMDVQREINALSKDHGAKSVRNHHGFISAVLGMFNPNLRLTTTLPQKAKNEPYIPSGEDVKKILDKAKGTVYEIPVILACYGLRRSEICAIRGEDVNGDVIRIDKAMVLNEKKEWVIKSTKTTSSTREIIVPKEVADKIKEKGYAYRGHPNSILYFLNGAQDSLGIPRFSIHKLRHYFASQMSALGVPDEDIMKLGGWETDYVMKSVYRHSMMDKEERAKRDAAEKLRSTLFS